MAARVRHPWKTLPIMLLAFSALTLPLLRGWETAAVARGQAEQDFYHGLLAVKHVFCRI